MQLCPIAVWQLNVVVPFSKGAFDVKREFYYQDDKSNKFWTIELVRAACVTTHGRIGAKPRETQREFPDEEAARREFDKQVAAKVKKGYVEGAINAAPANAKPDWSAMTMSDDVFWQVIRLLNWRKSGDDNAVIEPAVAALAKMDVVAIERFEDILAEKLYALDTEAHAREIGEYAYEPDTGFSVDWFLYERCVVVANGRDLYESVLADPSKMPKDMEFESLLSVARSAYERKTGKELDYATSLSYETFSNREGWSS
jgi:predicted DNA-binding WGR domain protein